MSIETTTAPQQQDTAPVEAPRTSGQAVWPVVMMREIVVKLRDRNFVVGTVVTLLLLAGGLGFQAFMSGKSNEVTAAVTGDGARQVMQQVGDSASQRGDDMVLTVTAAADSAAVEAAVRDGKADVGLVHGSDGWRLVGKTDVRSSMTSAVTASVRDRTLAANAQSAGTTVAALTAGGEVTTQLLEADSNEGLKVAVGLIFSFLFYFASIMFGMAIATSVVEEKQSRVVEILVSAVPLRQLLAGKVLGNVLLALSQMVLFVGVGLIGMAFTSYAPQIGLVASSAGWFLVFFVAGFSALACLWAVAGSLATRSEGLQSTTPVLTTVLMVAMFVGLFGEGTVRVVGSYVPVVSAISMPQRLLAGEAAWWEPFASLLVTLAFAAWTMVIGERLYKRSILNTGRRLNVREVLKADA
jgi:ABC-2 type transport system permease protein